MMGVGWVGDLRNAAFGGFAIQGVSRPAEKVDVCHLPTSRLHPVHQSRRPHDSHDVRS